MIIASQTSLSATLDRTAEAFFYQIPIPIPVREEIATLVISRQCQSGVNSGFFIPFTSEIKSPGILFSGEKLTTAFARKHFCLIESARILMLLGVENQSNAQSIHAAAIRMEKMCYSKFCSSGECRALTIAYLRYLILNTTDEPDQRINAFLTRLSTFRDGKGKWRGFPFYFTLLMLSEAGAPQAIQELHYSAQYCNKLRAGKWNSNPISKRRQAIITSALARS